MCQVELLYLQKTKTLVMLGTEFIQQVTPKCQGNLYIVPHAQEGCQEGCGSRHSILYFDPSSHSNRKIDV